MSNDTKFFANNGSFDIDYRNRHFKDVGGKNVTFEKCDFSYCVFERAYFHKATFKDCKFVGARMSQCNFRSAKFQGCDFSYSSFDNTYIPRSEVTKNLPYQPNIKRDLIRALRANAITMGDHDTSNSLLSLELKSDTEHHRNVFINKHSYYNKYSIQERVSSFFSYIGLRLENSLWGFGLSPIRLVGWTSIMLFICATLITEVDLNDRNLLQSYYISFKICFFALMDLALVPPAILSEHSAIFALLVGTRTVMLGLLITIIYRRYAR